MKAESLQIWVSRTIGSRRRRDRRGAGDRGRRCCTASASDPDAVHRPACRRLGPLGVLLLAYLGAGVWAWKRRGVEPEAALRTGAGMGILFGVAGVANLTLEYLGDLRPPFNAIVPATQMGVMVVLFGAAATLDPAALASGGSRAPGSRLERRRRHVADLRLRFSAATGGPAATRHREPGKHHGQRDPAHGDRAGRRGHGGGARDRRHAPATDRHGLAPGSLWRCWTSFR